MQRTAEQKAIEWQGATNPRASVASLIGRNSNLRGTDRILRLLHPPNTKSPIEAVVRGNGALRYHVRTDSYIEWHLFMYGQYEVEVTEAIVTALQRGDNVIDIGSNVGVHTLPAASAVGPSGHVYAFEPFEETRLRLEQNAAINRLTNVRTYAVALSDTDGEEHFREPTDENRGTGQFDPDGAVVVRTARLDALGLPAARVIKIDAEGAESRIVDGAAYYLAEHRPIVIYEHFPHVRDRAGERLEALGYRTTRLRQLTRVAMPASRGAASMPIPP